MEEKIAAAEKGGKKGGKAGAKSEDAAAARIMIRALWAQQWTEANPDKPVAERAKAWAGVRKEHTEAQLKSVRRAMSIMKRFGLDFTVTERAGKGEAAAE